MAAFRWLTLLMLISGTAAFAESEAPQVTDLERAIVSQPVWLNTTRALTADDLRGRIILLDFWTLGCINCMDIIPDLKSLEQEFGNQLTVIGVHSAKFAGEKQTESIKNAVMRYGVSHPVVNDSDFAIWNAFGVKAWPTLVLMNPEGNIANVYAGEGNKAVLEADIKALLEKYKGKITTAALPLGLESSKQKQTVFRFPGKIIAGNWEHGKQLESALFVADSGHNRIVVTDVNGAIRETIGDGKEGLKDGSFEQAEFYKPQGMAWDHGKSLLYVADLGNHALRLIDFNTRTVSTLAGTGAEGKFIDGTHEVDAAKTPLSSPWDVTFWPDGNHLVVAMAGAHQLWTYDINRKSFTLLAGNGQENLDDGHAPFASLAQPSGLLAAGDTLYFTDAESSALRKFTPDGNVTTLIGKGLFDFGYKEGGHDEARLQHCLGLTGDADHLYIADTYNNSIRRYDIKDGTLHNYAGHNARGAVDGALADASFNEPGGITKSGDTLFVADTNNHEIRAIDTKTDKVITSGAPSTAATSSSPAIAPAANAPSPSPSPSPSPVPAPAAKTSPSNLFFYVAPDAPIDVTLALKDGWHVNDTASSQLSLLDKGGNPLLGFGLDMLKTDHLRLPPLKGGKPYHLDGIIYYCADAKGSLCLIRNLNVTLLSTGKDTAITLPVN